MARKSIVTGTAGAGFCGPFVDGNDNVYVVALNGSAEVEVYKAGTDPLVDSWTAQDASNNPVGAVTVSTGLSAFQDGTEIHIAAWDNTNSRYEYHVFRTSDHASADTWGTTDDIIETPTDAPTNQQHIRIIKRTSDFVIIYNGDRDKIHGTSYDRCDYVIGTPTSWGSVTHFGDATPASTQASEYVRGIGRGESVGGPAEYGVYFLYDPANANGLEIKYLDESDSLLTTRGGSSAGSGVSGTTITTAGLTILGQMSPRIIYYDDSGVEVMTIGYFTSTGNLQSRQTRDGTLQSTQDFATGVSNPPWTSLAVDGIDAYMVYRDSSDSDPEYILNSDGGGWGTETSFEAATAPTDISANVIDHGGGKVLAIVYDDGDVYYDELSIAAAAAPYLPYYGHRRKIDNPLLRR